jgi:glycosyltransferase involved in cell wall biosynthesis
MPNVQHFSWPFSYRRKKPHNQLIICLFAQFLGMRFGAVRIINMRKGVILCSYSSWYKRIYDRLFAILSIDTFKGQKSYPATSDRWTKRLDKVPIGSILVCPNINEILPEDKDNFLREMAEDMDRALLCIVTAKVPPEISDFRLSTMKQDIAEMLINYGFHIGFSGYCTETLDNPEKNNIMWILCPHRAPVEIQEKDFNTFKVVAIIATYNEEDIIASIIGKLASQGIGVYIIDNWSTDSTINILNNLYKQGTILGFERYPAEGPSEIFDLKGILTRKEELAQKLKADWIIHHDADEVRLSPWKERNFKEAIYLVDKMGFNAIDHTMIDFVPVENGFTSDIDLESYFTYFKFNRSPLPRINAWKNLGSSVDLVSRGGHEVKFKGRRVFPLKFLIKHYPVRSQDHGERKFLQERQPRSEMERRKLGWHIHYYKYGKGYSFLGNPERLLLFDNHRFWEQYLVERLSGIISIHTGK